MRSSLLFRRWRRVLLTLIPLALALLHVSAAMPLLNGVAIGSSPVPLKSGDKLELAGTEMQFEQT